MKRRWLCLVTLPLAWSGPSAAMTLKDEFAKEPNAPVCVQFDVQGHVLAVLVNGRDDDKQLNSEMLTLLQSRHWEVPPAAWMGKWVALSVNAAGGPVPEVLPSCP
jgi:hypothetical protein